MNSAVIVLSVFSMLLAIAAAFFFYKSTRSSRAAPDPSLALLQQQLDGLRLQLSETLSRTAEITNQQLAAIAAQVQQQMSSVTHSLETTTGQINTRLDGHLKNITDKLISLSDATVKIFEVTKNISTLEEILKPPKLRGGMGEILLENVLREILPANDFFELQHPFKSGDTVDAVIRLKDGLIPIDAKFPLDNFRRMIESQEQKEKMQLRKEFIRNVKKHIDDIADKYILPDEGTFNFALMYVPAENVYYETIIREEHSEEKSADLYSYATAKHVFPVSPNSLYPYLMTIALGFRGLKIEQQAQEILSELSRLQGDMERFSKDFMLVGDHLANAQKKFNESEKKLGQLQTKIASFKEGTPELPSEPSLLK